MPSNPTTSQEQRRMITFDAIAPDGTREQAPDSEASYSISRTHEEKDRR